MEQKSFDDSLKVDNKGYEFSKLYKITELLQNAATHHEILIIILAGFLVNKLPKFNRAFLFLLNDEKNILEGRVSVGPFQTDELCSLSYLLEEERYSVGDNREFFRDGIKSSKIQKSNIEALTYKNVQNSKSLLIQAIRKKKPIWVHQEKADISFDKNILNTVESDSFVAVPLVLKYKTIGVIVFSYDSSNHPVKDIDIQILEIFSHQAALTIDYIQLRKKMDYRLKELENAYSNLQESQERLIKVEKLASLGEMISKIADEIKNPLTTIGGFTKNLLKNFPHNDDNRKYIEIINKEVSKLEGILANILSYTKLYEPKKSLVKIEDVIDSTILTMIDDIEKGNVSLNIDIKNKDLELNIDSDQVSQVFSNLIKNAIHSMPEGGDLKIVCKKKGRFCIINFEDTGCGIEKENINKILTPFYGETGKGLGLGLSVAQKIIESHKGKIKITSIPGKGSIFEISLPLLL